MKNNSVAVGILATVVLVGTSTSVWADDETFTASATILEALAVTKAADLSFASIAPDTTNSGTVVVAPDGSRTCDAALSCTGTTVAADFDVTGSDGASFNVSLPSAANIADGSGNSMTVDNFSSSLAGNTGTISGGTADFQIGATLNVAANQVAGAYSGTFTVTVEYN